jgi:release factor glutamine methyltransferase
LNVLYRYLTKNLKLSESSAFTFIYYFFGLTKNDVFLHSDQIITLNNEIKKKLILLNNGYPLSYITKSADFYGLEFYIDERVLIPRPETEILVDEVLKRIKASSVNILDLCTGSGCILISILKNLKKSKGIGLDISFDALKVARSNAKKIEVNANFICGDCIQINNMFKNNFDVITCNPPYVGLNDEIDDSIRFEPRNAIFAKDNGLYFYKNLLSIINKLCKKNGIVCFEIGFNMKNKLIKICSDNNIQPEFIKDYSGKDRIMIWKNL